MDGREHVPNYTITRLSVLRSLANTPARVRGIVAPLVTRCVTTGPSWARRRLGSAGSYHIVSMYYANVCSAEQSEDVSANKDS